MQTSLLQISLWIWYLRFANARAIFVVYPTIFRTGTFYVIDAGAGTTARHANKRTIRAGCGTRSVIKTALDLALSGFPERCPQVFQLFHSLKFKMNNDLLVPG